APSPMPKAVQKAAPAHVKPGMHKPVAAVAKKTSSNSAAKTGSTNKVQASQKAVPMKAQPMAKVKNPPVKAGVLPEKKGQKPVVAKPVTAKPATAHKAAPPIRVLPVKPKAPAKAGAVGASNASRNSTNKTATRPPEPAPK